MYTINGIQYPGDSESAFRRWLRNQNFTATQQAEAWIAFWACRGIIYEHFGSAEDKEVQL